MRGATLPRDAPSALTKGVGRENERRGQYGDRKATDRRYCSIEERGDRWDQQEADQREQLDTDCPQQEPVRAPSESPRFLAARPHRPRPACGRTLCHTRTQRRAVRCRLHTRAPSPRRGKTLPTPIASRLARVGRWPAPARQTAGWTPRHRRGRRSPASARSASPLVRRAGDLHLSMMHLSVGTSARRQVSARLHRWRCC